jgi:hypothetical protein
MSNSVEVFQEPVRPDQIAQGPGQSEEKVMSQKAVTDKFALVDEAIAGAGTGIFEPVADLVALKALDTTIAEDWPDKWAIYVESVRLFYALDRESTSADDGDTVIAPTTGAGRWHRKVIPLATTLQDGLMPKEKVQQVEANTSNLKKLEYQLDFRGTGDNIEFLFDTKINNLSVVLDARIASVVYRINGGADITTLADLQTAIDATVGNYNLYIKVTYSGTNAQGTLIFKASKV